MSAVLALETSGSLCSVCLDADGNRFEITHHVDRRHNELLLGMIEEVLQQAHVDRSSLSGLAFGCGPGSFTGVRIAAACVQALALAFSLPVVPVASSDALAHAAVHSGNVVEDCELVTSIRSRRNHYYLSSYRHESGTLVCTQPAQLHDSAESMADQFKESVYFVGAQPEWWTEAAWLEVSATAADVLDIALSALEQQQGVVSAQALPLYVVGDTPWQKRSKA